MSSGLYTLRSTPQRSKVKVEELTPLSSGKLSSRQSRSKMVVAKGEDEGDEEDGKPAASAAALASTLASFGYNSGASPRKKRALSPSKTDASPSSTKKARTRTASTTGTSTPSPKKAKAIQMELTKPHPAPKHWEKQYELIREMREKLVAAVDTMGCDRPRDTGLDPKSRRLTILTALMLSSQTKDETTSQAVTNLQEALGGSITLPGLISASDTTIEGAICKVGFWRRKTQYIKQTAVKLRDEFDSDVPKTVDELCSLPGVGPKMAFLALQAAWDINSGIGVDTHVHRITNRLGWHKPATTTPEQTRLNLQSWLPKDRYSHINGMLVGFGQALCYPVAPRCDLCELAAHKLCPSAQKVGNIKGRKEVIWKEGWAKTKVEVEVVGEIGGRNEMKLLMPGEGIVEMDVKDEDLGTNVGALAGDVVEEAHRPVDKKGKSPIRDALDW